MGIYRAQASAIIRVVDEDESLGVYRLKAGEDWVLTGTEFSPSGKLMSASLARGSQDILVGMATFTHYFKKVREVESKTLRVNEITCLLR